MAGLELLGHVDDQIAQEVRAYDPAGMEHTKPGIAKITL
jgi:hypothetical protein